MAKNKLCKGDEVVVIAGNHKGKSGKVLSKKGKRIIVEGINVRKKHMKPTQQNQKGQIIDIEISIDASNVKPFIDGNAVKLRTRCTKENGRELYYIKDNKEVVHRSLKKAKS